MHVIYGLGVNVSRQNNKFESDWLIYNSTRDLSARKVARGSHVIRIFNDTLRSSNLLVRVIAIKDSNGV